MARILLVDDMSGVRNALGTVLRGRGHEIVEASDGEIGLKKANCQNIDLVITDIVMPATDGAHLVSELKRRRPNLPIIAMSGGSQGIDGQQMLNLAAGKADILLAKPFARNELLDAINQLVVTAKA